MEVAMSLESKISVDERAGGGPAHNCDAEYTLGEKTNYGFFNFPIKKENIEKAHQAPHGDIFLRTYAATSAVYNIHAETNEVPSNTATRKRKTFSSRSVHYL